MTSTQYFTATTLNGYLADENNSLDWLFEVDTGTPDGGPPGYAEFFGQVGAMAMGATTYEWICAHEPDWAKWYGDTPAWVFTHWALTALPGGRITFVAGDVRPVHAAMVDAAAGKNIWIVGGGELAGSFADHGLLDELILGVAPVTLAGGAPLLPRRLTASRLTLTSVTQTGQLAELRYRLSPPA